MGAIPALTGATTGKGECNITNGDAVTYATIGHGGSPATPAKDEIYAFAGELAEEKALVIGVTDKAATAGSGKVADVTVLWRPVVAGGYYLNA